MTKSRIVKYLVRLLIWVWVSYWVTQIFIGDLGAAPALRLNHELGDIALTVLTVNLAVGALLQILIPAPKWLRFWMSERRFWGVSGFLVLTAHVFFYFLNEGFEFKAWTQLVTKSYLIFASLSFLILLALAVTSNNFSLRKLGGKNWKRLHRAVYLAQILLFFHILAIEKADLLKYGIWLGSILLLQLIRVVLGQLSGRRKAGRLPIK